MASRRWNLGKLLVECRTGEATGQPIEKPFAGGKSAKGNSKGHGPPLAVVRHATDLSVGADHGLGPRRGLEIFAKVNWPSWTSPTPGANTFTLFSLPPLVSVRTQFVNVPAGVATFSATSITVSSLRGLSGRWLWSSVSPTLGTQAGPV